MKIEIGESLLLSWLRHAKNCQLVQTNWKPSMASWELQNEDIIDKVFNDSNVYFREKYGFEIYKGNATYTQLMQQAEVDVIGISIDKDNNQELYAIDVAFHEAGLNYGDKTETVERVIKKYIRAALCITGFFGFKTGYIVFASPKINKGIYEALLPCVEEVKSILGANGLDFKIRLIANEDFKEKIFEPVIASALLISDTSELFMRSIQMYNLFENSSNRVQKTRKTANTSEPIYSGSLAEMKIGALVKSTLLNMFSNDEISQGEIEQMTTPSYSKTVFNLNFPLLKEIDENQPVDEQRLDSKGRGRYWTNIVKLYDRRYYICSQWVEEQHRSYFNKWLQTKSNFHEQK